MGKWGCLASTKKSSISITFSWFGSLKQLFAMKYLVNGVFQKHMILFLFYQNLVDQVVGNKALMGMT